MRKDRKKYNNQTGYYKIDIFGCDKDSDKWMYLCSTDQSKTCKIAVQNYILRHPNFHLTHRIKANYDRS